MSHENVEIVRRLIQAFNDRDDQAVTSLLDDEAEFESLTLQTYKGKAGLLEYRRNLDEAWSERRLEADRCRPGAPERGAPLQRVGGRRRGSDLAVSQDIAIIWTLRDGRVVRGKAFRY